jgi:hypothetical protein
MGYYTYYELSIKKGDDNLISEFIKSNVDAPFALDSSGYSRQECRWYNHENDLKEFSLKYPETLFELKGEGEEHSDSWIKYIQNGKCQTCRGIITFDDFDETKLK